MAEPGEWNEAPRGERPAVAGQPAPSVGATTTEYSIFAKILSSEQDSPTPATEPTPPPATESHLETG
eukprot:2302063-Pyramimonas_sp.AAC.1